MEDMSKPHALQDLLLVKDASVEAQYANIPLPSLVVRIKAVALDLLLLLGVFTGASLVIDAVGDIHPVVRGFILVFMIYGYDPVFTSLAGSTVGQKLMRLKVRRFSDPARRITLPYAFLRFFVKGCLGWISFFTVTGNRQKRAIHDIIGGSIVLWDK